MKYYKDNNNQVWAYENDVPEFGQGDEGNITVKKGLISITEEEAKSMIDALNKPTQKQILANNETTIKSLTQEATLKINTLQDAIDLKMEEDGDEERLKAWKKYRVLLSKMDTDLEKMKLPKKPQ